MSASAHNLESRAPRPDAELVAAARRGDKQAFVEIVARHQAMLCGVSFAILADFAASEDAAQEAFLTAWRRIADLREPDRLRPWLAQIARNAARAQLRRRKPDEPLDPAEELPDHAPTPEEAAATEEEAALVRAALEKLPENYRLPLVLFYREGQSVRAVAEALGLSDDAVKQRLARGREMMRDRMSSLVESTLARTGPSAVFTMTVAAAIGALAAPSVVAASVLSASAGSAAAATSTTSTLFSAMSTTKGLAATAAIVAALCVPAGFQLDFASAHRPGARVEPPSANSTGESAARRSFERSGIFAEWQALHAKHGTNAAAMPAIFAEIQAQKDSVRRRAFELALVAEWAAVDGSGGMQHLLRTGGSDRLRDLLFREWLRLDPKAAIDGLLGAHAHGPAKAVEATLRGALKEIARLAPGRVPGIAAWLPKAESVWDNSVDDAFAILAEKDPAAWSELVEKLPGPNREAARAGVARAWAKIDVDAAIRWARDLPEGTDHDEIIRGALVGLASRDPAAALDRVSLVPTGGRQGYYAATTGARVLRAASTADFEGTVEWLAANRGRLSREDLMGITDNLTARLNSDPAGFLTTHANDGSLSALTPALDSALLNGAGGLRSVVWDWLKKEPANEATEALRTSVLRSAAWQEPDLAYRLGRELPSGPEGDQEAKDLAQSLLNGGWRLPYFEQIYAQAPERLRPDLLRQAFDHLGPEVINDPLPWTRRAEELPPAEREQALPKIARAWAMKRPEEAAAWARSLPDAPARENTLGMVAGTWIDQDELGAVAWIGSLPPGPDRDRSAEELVYRRAGRYPEESRQWALGIGDELHRTRAVFSAVQSIGVRDPSAAQKWIDTVPLSEESKAQLQSILQKMAHP